MRWVTRCELYFLIQGLLQQHTMADFGRAVGSAPPDARSVAAAYRCWALTNPHLYELAARRRVRRDIVGETEAFAAAPVLRAVGGGLDTARAFLCLAHRLVDLVNDHFPVPVHRSPSLAIRRSNA